MSKAQVIFESNEFMHNLESWTASFFVRCFSHTLSRINLSTLTLSFLRPWLWLQNWHKSGENPNRSVSSTCFGSFLKIISPNRSETWCRPLPKFRSTFSRVSQCIPLQMLVACQVPGHMKICPQPTQKTVSWRPHTTPSMHHGDTKHDSSSKGLPTEPGP